MRKKLILAISIGVALLGATSLVNAYTVPSWDFEAYGGFSKLDVGFPNPGYNVLLTPLPPRDHQDMGSFRWSVSTLPSLLGINQKEPLTHGQTWKAPGRYYGQKKPVQPGITSIHGETIGEIITDDNGDDDDIRGEVIGWAIHYNKPIPETFGEDPVARVGVNYHLRLFDPNTDTLAWDSGEMFFLIDVWETHNTPVDDCCPDGNENATYPNQSGCADRFRVGVLADFNGNGDIDVDDLLKADVGSCFNEVVGSFTYMDVDYNVSLTGFWETGEEGAELIGEGWSPEYEFTHFEVRAEVRVAPQVPG
jgi:hypothetical protein